MTLSGLKTFAQSNLKLYSNLDFVNQRTFIRSLDGTESFEDESIVGFGRPSLAISFIEEKFDHEIELSYSWKALPVSYDLDAYRYSNDRIQTRYFGFQYELIFLRKKIGQKMVLKLSAGSLLYWSRWERAHLTYPITLEERIIGIQLNLIPRVEFDLGSRFMMDINSKLSIFEQNDSHWKIDDPNLPPGLRRFSQPESTFLNLDVNVRIGLVYRLRKKN